MRQQAGTGSTHNMSGSDNKKVGASDGCHSRAVSLGPAWQTQITAGSRANYCAVGAAAAGAQVKQSQKHIKRLCATRLCHTHALPPSPRRNDFTAALRWPTPPTLSPTRCTQHSLSLLGVHHLGNGHGYQGALSCSRLGLCNHIPALHNGQ